MPTITGMTNDGVVTIRFSTPMQIPNLRDIQSSRVALRLTQAVGYQDYLTEDGYSTFEIRDAVEVNMVSSDVSDDVVPIEFSWEIVSFSEYEAKIQIKYEVPESVSSSSTDPDSVQISFWAGDLFQSQDGSSMRPGLTINAPVIR